MSILPKSPADSSVETTHLVLPGDTNTHGTAFGGRIMQWMDICAGISAGRHTGLPVVTVAVDELVFKRTIKMGDVVVLKARVNYTGRTSLEVGVRVEREKLATQARELCLTGYFTFVAVDDEGKPVAVPVVDPVGDDDKRRFSNAERRREQRLRNR